MPRNRVRKQNIFALRTFSNVMDHQGPFIFLQVRHNPDVIQSSSQPPNHYVSCKIILRVRANGQRLSTPPKENRQVFHPPPHQQRIPWRLPENLRIAVISKRIFDSWLHRALYEQFSRRYALAEQAFDVMLRVYDDGQF